MFNSFLGFFLLPQESAREGLTPVSESGLKENIQSPPSLPFLLPATENVPASPLPLSPPAPPPPPPLSHTSWTPPATTCSTFLVSSTRSSSAAPLPNDEARERASSATCVDQSPARDSISPPFSASPAAPPGAAEGDRDEAGRIVEERNRGKVEEREREREREKGRKRGASASTTEMKFRFCTSFSTSSPSSSSFLRLAAASAAAPAG